MYFFSIEELRPPGFNRSRTMSESISMATAQQQQQPATVADEWSPLHQVASSSAINGSQRLLPTAQPTTRPLLMTSGLNSGSDANSHNDLRFVTTRMIQQQNPPELPLRRGGSTDHVVDSQSSTINTKSSSGSGSSSQQLHYSASETSVAGSLPRHHITIVPPNLISLKVYHPSANLQLAFSSVKCAESTTVEVWFLWE